MEHFWPEIDDAVLQCLAVGDATPAEIGQHLGISEAGAASILAMLVIEGKVRISRVSREVVFAGTRSAASAHGEADEEARIGTHP